MCIGVELGGQLARVTLIENYPGTGPVSGTEIIRRTESMVRKYSNVRIELDEVVRVIPEESMYRVLTRSGHEYRTYAVIVASGKMPRRLRVPDEEKYLGRGLSYCVVCDAPFFRGRRVLLVSTYKPGLKMEISILGLYCSVLYWVPESVPEDVINDVVSELRDKVQVLRGYKVKSIVGDEKVRGVVLEGPDGSEVKLDVDGVFVELGYEFRTDFIKDLVQTNERGEIVIDTLCRTSREGIFAAGDVTAVPFKQAIIAAGQGATAALSAAEYLSKRFGLKARRLDWHKEFSDGFRIRLKL